LVKLVVFDANEYNDDVVFFLHSLHKLLQKCWTRMNDRMYKVEMKLVLIYRLFLMDLPSRRQFVVTL